MRRALLVLGALAACGPASPRRTTVVGDARLPRPYPPPAPLEPLDEPEDASEEPYLGPEVCGPRGWADCVVNRSQGHSASALKSFRAHFAKQCAARDVASCVKLGVMMANGDGGSIDDGGAFRAFSIACEDDVSTCAYIALALRTGDGVLKDEDMAAKVAAGVAPPPRESRTYDSLRARRGSSLYGDEVAAEGQDTTRIVDAYVYDCGEGRAEGCVKAAVMHEQAPGEMKRDAEEAFRLFWVACDLDKSMCMDISQAYADGDKVHGNEKHAKRFRKQALSPERSKEAARCRYGDADRCVTFAFAYLAGEHVGRDEDYAAVLFEEACRGGDARGCAGLADLRWSGKGTYKDRHASIDLFEKACKGDLGSACWKLGRLYLRGEEIDQDLARAKRLFKRACDLGDQAGCKFVDSAP